MSQLANQSHARKLLGSDERLIFIRGGWMKYYDPRHDTLPPQGGGSFNDDDTGWEKNNFRPYRGRCYIYTRARWNKPLTLRRLGAPSGDEEVHRVMVVQVATRPAGGQVVVGWFRGATAYADWQHRPFAQEEGCCFIAPADQSALIPEDQRDIPVPKGVPGAMGQSQVRYASDPSGRLSLDPWMIDILEHIRKRSTATPARIHNRILLPRDKTSLTGQGRGLTAAQRKAVETFAMARATEYYQARYDSVEDVHTKQPFDLLCANHRDPGELRVEVKGTTGDAGTILVTQGEVRSANTHPTALFIASSLTWKDKTAAILDPKQWRQHVIDPWIPAPVDLTPTVYQWNNPAMKDSRR